ncbi:MAG: hypothetical protein PVH19_05390 [Planctomycetia bacterium]|jgi:hypothetical protein
MRVEEDFNSRSQTKDHASLAYFVFECTNEQDAITAALNFAPGTYAGMYYEDHQYDSVNDETHRIEIQYSVNGSASENRSTWRYATNGGTTRIKQALLNVGNYAPDGQTPPNFYGAIGVTPNGIEGVDVVSPNCSYSESHYKILGVFTAAYANTLALMTGTVNNAPFRAWAAGEVLFAGATMQSQDRNGVTIEYDFLLSPNATNITNGNITVPAKYGWDYLWYTYYTGFDDTTGCLVEMPRSAHLDRVYPFTDFGALLI